MNSGAITDAQISASSQWDNNHGASRARLHMQYQKRAIKEDPGQLVQMISTNGFR